MLSGKPISDDLKKRIRHFCDEAMPHAPITISTGVATNARYVNENYVVFDLIIPVSLGMGMEFENRTFDNFEFFYTQEREIWVKISDIKPFILENLFKQKFFTVGYQIVFVRKDNSFIQRALAFEVDVPTNIYEEWFLQHVVTFIQEPISENMKLREKLFKQMLKPRLEEEKKKRKKKDASKLIKFKSKESKEGGEGKE